MSGLQAYFAQDITTGQLCPGLPTTLFLYVCGAGRFVRDDLPGMGDPVPEINPPSCEQDAQVARDAPRLLQPRIVPEDPRQAQILPVLRQLFYVPVAPIRLSRVLTAV